MKVCLAFVCFVLAACTGLRAQTVYFPDRVLGDYARSRELRKNWYTNFLKAMDEPSLWEMSKDGQARIYRFLWLRTFDPPITSRLSINSDGTGTLVFKMTNGAGGYKPGKVTTNRTISIAKEQVDEFLRLLEEANICPEISADSHTMPPGCMTSGSRQGGLDGAQWILEGVRGKQYFFVDQWSPESGPFRRLCLYLGVKLTKIKIRTNDIY